MYQLIVTTQGAPRLMRPAHFHNTIDNVQSASIFGQNPAGASIVSSTKYKNKLQNSKPEVYDANKKTFKTIFTRSLPEFWTS